MKLKIDRLQVIFIKGDPTMHKPIELDRTDLLLLELVQANARMPAAELADAVGLSAPACYRRLQRLRAEKAITREAAIVAPRTMGWPVSMIVLLTLQGERAHIIDAFIRSLADVPEIIQAWYVTGDYDFAVHVIARDMESYEEMTNRIFYANEHIKTFKTLVTLRQAKQFSPVKVAR